MKKILIACCLQTLFISFLSAQDIKNNPVSNHGNKFEQLGTILPTGNEYRTASGAPGSKYWQQRCDYDIKCELDEKKTRLTGSETITYYNNSPDILPYLWLQLDENQHSSANNANYQDASSINIELSSDVAENMLEKTLSNEFGFNITRVVDFAGKPMKYIINKTMMRIDLATPLKPGQKIIFSIDWNYKIFNRINPFILARGGYEYFPEDGNYIFTMTQWYPRLCVYSDFQGWQNHQFTGRGEFALTFGNYKVQMTVPADHVVSSTGECQNYTQLLSPVQMGRWQKAQNAKDVIEIVTLEEAKAAEKQNVKSIASASPRKKTYIFKADNVRDFAWGSSPKFVWDAMPVVVEGKKIMCMSFYAKEAYGIYRRYSTKAVTHAIKTYSGFSIPYPYPVAQSVEAANGMEYPMICFNPGRTEKDGTYTEQSKNSAITVIIHEVGHNFYPMIINSDERQWTWLDEGLNTFVQTLAEETWDNKYASTWSKAYITADYMKLPKDQLEPIMTNSENINEFFTNQYVKTATGLNILRETIMGRDLFDYAFKEYARRWAFKHPTPADFFRTMEDASGEDLDWFWRGWFYSIDATDISIDSVKYFRPDFTNNRPQRDTVIYRTVEKPRLPAFDDISKVRNREAGIVFQTDADTSLRDFYWRYARGIEKYDTTRYPQESKTGSAPPDEETIKELADKHFYEIKFSNKGGLAMPIILEWIYKDGTKEIEKIPAQIWRKNENSVTKAFVKNQEVVSIKLDPMKETADIDESNNNWPAISTPSKFQVFKSGQAGRNQPQPGNPMQKAEEKKKAF